MSGRAAAVVMGRSRRDVRQMGSVSCGLLRRRMTDRKSIGRGSRIVCRFASCEPCTARRYVPNATWWLLAAAPISKLRAMP